MILLFPSGLHCMSFPISKWICRGSQGAKAKFKIPRSGMEFYYMFGEMVDTLHHICPPAREAFYKNGSRSRISQDQGYLLSCSTKLWIFG